MARAADVNLTAAVKHPLVLRVAAQAKVRVLRHQHFAVYRTVWLMANRAAFVQRFVLENKRAGLFTMTLGAIFVDPGHGESAARFHDVRAMRVMTVDAAHSAFEN